MGPKQDGEGVCLKGRGHSRESLGVKGELKFIKMKMGLRTERPTRQRRLYTNEVRECGTYQWKFKPEHDILTGLWQGVRHLEGRAIGC